MKEFKVDLVHCFRRSLKHSFLLMIILAGWSGRLFAQAGTISTIPQVLSPDAAALGKFVEVPVSNYSGLPKIDIPIYEFKVKDQVVPLSLSYHASGVKVKELPGMVGANWALFAGGTVTRIVRGEPDGNSPDAPGYYRLNAALLGHPGYNYPDQRLMTGIMAEYTGALKEDMESDIYYYNFMGHTGRFTFDNSGHPYMLDVNDMKIEYTAGTLIIYDTEGVSYTFGHVDNVEWYGHSPYISTWYLDDISIPRKDDHITFSYKKYNNWRIYRFPWAPFSYSDRVLYQDIFPPYGATTNPACVNTPGISDATNLSQGETCIIDKISFGGDSVKFYHDTSRADVYQVRLDSIRVFQGPDVIHTTRFGFSFINSGSSDPKDKKMLLTSVQSNDQPAYTMSYYGSFNGMTMPGPYANASDLWGYYNGQSYSGSTPYSTPRNPDYRYGQIGSLQTLTYPTGGSTEFTYEGNDFSYCQNVLDSVGSIFKAGGLRIKKIKFTSPLTSSSFEKTYEYTHGTKSSGVLEAPFANISSTFYWGEGRPGVYGPYCTTPWPQVCSFLVYHHENVIPLGNTQGGAIGYAQVTERNSDGSKKVMQFTNGGFDPYTYWPLSDPLLDGYSDQYSSDYLGDKVIQDRIIFDYSAYRGKLKGLIYYNGSGQKIRQEVHKFSDLISDRLSFYDQPKTTNIYLAPADFHSSGSECGYFGPPDYGLVWSVYWHQQRNLVPVVDSIYTFNGTDTLKEVTKYNYNGPLHSFASRIVQVGALGDSTITTNQYVWDYNATTTGMGQTAYWNNVSQPVESTVTKKDAGGGNPRVINAQLITYKPYDPFPNGLYKLSNSTGLTDFSPYTVNNSGIGIMDSRYLPELRIQRFDNRQYVTEQRKLDEPKEVLVWGYQHRFVVARITDSDYPTVMALVDSTVLDHPSSDAVMRTELAKIRTGLASTDSKVTTYTYATLKGVTSVTDPMGQTTYYEYDNYGRLKRRKDLDGYVKDNIWYHYKP